ncbi:hypothetical protein [Curtobacterium sp. MCBD17_040]|uniref:hypothetical protein n=1 Tax=Curtobacterium sp. MCBD17_040 TaxID=2175674 RepID=UPI0011B77B53|nr:hypothetical protein [Curtobacterium sp. MCBD17_040]WIB65487.1 hypothetical protein DEI94_19125 [Curtobacterium sp. MCBD17_040]
MEASPSRATGLGLAADLVLAGAEGGLIASEAVTAGLETTSALSAGVATGSGAVGAGLDWMTCGYKHDKGACVAAALNTVALGLGTLGGPLEEMEGKLPKALGWGVTVGSLPAGVAGFYEDYKGAFGDDDGASDSDRGGYGPCR